MRAKIQLFSLFFLMLSCSQANFSGVSRSDAVYHASGTVEQESFDLSHKSSKLDILILVDASESMYHHLTSFGDSLRELLSVISNYDWRIGITSTDHGDHGKTTVRTSREAKWDDSVNWHAEKGKFGTLMPLQKNHHELSQERFLTKNVPNYENIFRLTLSHQHLDERFMFPPYRQDPLEQPMRSLKSFIERVRLNQRPGGTSDFFRVDADFVAIILTNEDERLEDQARATTAYHVMDTFNNLLGYLGKKFFAFSFIVTDNYCLEQEKDRAKGYLSLPRLIPQLAHLTGGYNSSICSDNYGRDLKELSRYVKRSIENSVLLKHDPAPETVQVEFLSGREIPWKLVGRKIIFDTDHSQASGRVFYQRMVSGS